MLWFQSRFNQISTYKTEPRPDLFHTKLNIIFSCHPSHNPGSQWLLLHVYASTLHVNWSRSLKLSGWPTSGCWGLQAKACCCYQEKTPTSHNRRWPCSAQPNKIQLSLRQPKKEQNGRDPQTRAVENERGKSDSLAMYPEITYQVHMYPD